MDTRHVQQKMRDGKLIIIWQDAQRSKRKAKRKAARKARKKQRN